MKRRTFLKTAAALTGAAVLPLKKLRAEEEWRRLSFVGKKKVAIIGGGVGGLSAAHELLERGFEVEVYELKSIPGGKARSIDVPHSGTFGRKDLPGEHGFRFFPGFYKHLPDTMKRIPFGMKTTFDNLTSSSRIQFSRINKPDVFIPSGLPHSYADLSLAFQFAFKDHLDLTKNEVMHFAHRMHVYLTSCEERRSSEFEYIPWWKFINADDFSDAYRKVLALGATRSLVAMKAEVTSTRTIAAILTQLFGHLLGIGGNIDRLLNAPTNEAWIHPWMQHLTNLGLKYYGEAKAQQIYMNNDLVDSVVVEYEGKLKEVHADFFIFSVPVEAFRNLLNQQMIQNDSRFDNLKFLKTEWMNGIQFFLDEDLPFCNGHTLYLDSPWALTSISQKQFWKNIDLSHYGDGNVKGILSVDISDWTKPGILYGKPASECAKEEIKNEVLAQIKSSVYGEKGMDLDSVKIIDWFLDPGIRFQNAQVENDEPLLINTVGSWQHRPNAFSNITNMFLAADYVRTYTDLASMEAANEAARRAVNEILYLSGSTAARCELWPLQEPSTFAQAKIEDKLRFQNGQKNKFDN